MTEQSKVHQLSQKQPDGLQLSIEEVQKWLGELQLQIKLRDRVIAQQTEEIRRLRAALTDKKG